MQPIIEVHNIGKKFKIHHEKQPYLSVRDSLVNFIKSPFKNILSNSDEEFWALKDVSFNVYEGESIGIIGKNGAGKSTLLKILSRITPPSEGKIILRGRVASLLEVGTGFHPELTGRENVFFNGAILGMKRAEIKRKFDEIVDFAGVEKFIDTPLKHYSSGMQLRLAFAVAAFLEAEILVIDEVLAVGDAEFQKKCLGKMEEVSKQQGRTVLFVSHNLTSLKKLCNTSVLLEKGKLKNKDSSINVINEYLSDTYKDNYNETQLENLLKLDDKIIKILNFKLYQTNGKNLIYEKFSADEDIITEFIYEVKDFVNGLRVGFELLSNEGQIIFRSFHDDSSNSISSFSKGIYRTKAIIPSKFLAPTDYIINIAIGIHNISWISHNIHQFKISSNGLLAINKGYGAIHDGLLMPEINWENKQI
jgi:lipopolysaccharide transport system ATP-binding protein